jgi:hypothetical protein
MKISIIKKQATPSSSNLSFQYDSSVDQFLIGATQLYYTFGSHDHHVKKIKLNMAPSNSGNDVNATISMTLKDDSGNDISSTSYVDVTSLAALGQNSNSSVQLTSNLSFPSGSSSNQIGLRNNTYVNEALMEGFDMAFDGDHHVKRIHADVSVSVQQGSSATLSGTADMYDDSGNSATTKTLQGGYLGTYINGSDSGLVVVEQSYNTGEGLQHVDFTTHLGDKNLTGAAVFIKTYDLSFSGDHHMKSIRVGADGIVFDDKTVSFTPRADMTDNSGHNASGSVTLVIVGACDPI